jgi:DNA mismatch endonuclease (patch repair protein)
VAIFCDGDFWHGRQLRQRLKSLASDHNPVYWVAKIKGNVMRDKRNWRLLAKEGWLVLRFWETTIARNPSAVADLVERALIRAKKEKTTKGSAPHA